MFDRVLIANRGEIACRIIRTCRRLGVATVAVFSEADANALHVRMADESICIGPAPARDSYLRIDAIIDAARRTDAVAIHPGYGFLSENPAFAAACIASGFVFIGPPVEAMRVLSTKGTARAFAARIGLPVLPGHEGEQTSPALRAAADRIGFPVLVKAIAGGGGKGMRRVDRAEQFERAVQSAKAEAGRAFGDDRVLVEKCLDVCRHIEVQIFADGYGNAVHLYERDCSLQRRRQKIIEECPAPGLPGPMRGAMTAAALELVRRANYIGAGTVEFLVDASAGLRADRFYFLEMNTRLQVEHPVTEMTTGVDLVEWQLRVAAGEELPLRQHEISLRGHAIEARICAEDPARMFAPSPGRITGLWLPPASPEIRVETGVCAGDEVTPWYDSLLAKLVVHAPSRAEAIGLIARSLALSSISGVSTNLQLLHDLVCHDDFDRLRMHTGTIESSIAQPRPLAATESRT